MQILSYPLPMKLSNSTLVTNYLGESMSKGAWQTATIIYSVCCTNALSKCRVLNRNDSFI